ncbi:MAG TPA: hypothetical protein VLX28_10310 [Thermoanaerobaculia bacterium]|nr:hypothetical protein [Thermoanaerobaculia bacterium]
MKLEPARRRAAAGFRGKLQPMKITISLPDEMAERVRQLPDRDEFVTRAVEAALADSPPSPPDEGKPSRWAEMVKRIESQPSLGSYAKKFDADRKEFRRNFGFKHDER